MFVRSKENLERLLVSQPAASKVESKREDIRNTEISSQTAATITDFTLILIQEYNI